MLRAPLPPAIKGRPTPSLNWVSLAFRRGTTGSAGGGGRYDSELLGGSIASGSASSSSSSWITTVDRDRSRDRGATLAMRNEKLREGTIEGTRDTAEVGFAEGALVGTLVEEVGSAKVLVS
jgi:hypothetical protein